MLRKLRRLAEFSPIEWLLLLELIPLALVLRLSLGFEPLTGLTASLGRLAERPWLRRLPPLHRGRAIERLWLVADLAARMTCGRGRCLGRSLLLLWLLKARAQPAELLVGVNKDGEVFQAHAWIETEGRVLGDRPEMTAQFAVLLRA